MFTYLWQVVDRSFELYKLWSEQEQNPPKILSAIFNWGLESGEVSDEEYASAREFGENNECWNEAIDEIM